MKYKEIFDLGNSLTLRDGVNLVSKLVRTKFDTQPGVNGLRMKRFILGCFAGEPAANRFPENQTFEGWMKKKLEPSADSMGDVVDKFVNTYPIDALMSEKSRARVLNVPACDVIRQLMVNVNKTDTRAKAHGFLEKFPAFSQKIAEHNPSHATAIYQMSAAKGLEAYIVTFDGPQDVVSEPVSSEILAGIVADQGEGRLRHMNASIATMMLMDARSNEIPPTEPIAIPQIVKGKDDKHLVAYQSVTRQATDGTIFEELLAKIPKDIAEIKMAIPSLVQGLVATICQNEALSIGEVMNNPAATITTIKTGGTEEGKEAPKLSGHRFISKEAAKVTSTILIAYAPRLAVSDN